MKSLATALLIALATTSQTGQTPQSAAPSGQSPPSPRVIAPNPNAPRAVITMRDGSAAPTRWPLGRYLDLSAHASISGGQPGSFSWVVLDANVTANSGVEGTILHVGTGVEPKSVRFVLTVAKGDLLHVLAIDIEFYDPRAESHGGPHAESKTVPQP